MIGYVTRDFWIGIGTLVIAVVYRLEAGKIRVSALDDPVGASGLPKSLAYAFGALAVLLIVRDLAGAVAAARRDTPVSAEDERGSLGQIVKPHVRAAGMFAIGIAFLLVVTTLGYAISIGLLLLAVSLYNGATFGMRTLLVAFGGAVFYHLLFVEFLGIRLPAGLLAGLLGS